MITSSTHKEGPSIATSMKNSSVLMATTSSRLRAPIWWWLATSLHASHRRPSLPRSPLCLKRHNVKLMRSERIRDLRAPQARFADQPFLDPIATPVKAGSPTSHYLPRGELEATMLSIIANTTKRSNRTPECTSVTSRMHDGVLINAASGAMKLKYDAARSTSESTVIQTRL